MRGVLYVEDEVPELTELGTLQGLCEEIGEHVVSWAVPDVEFLTSDVIRYPEVPDIDMAGALPA